MVDRSLRVDLIDLRKIMETESIPATSHIKRLDRSRTRFIRARVCFYYKVAVTVPWVTSRINRGVRCRLDAHLAHIMQLGDLGGVISGLGGAISSDFLCDLKV